MRVEQIEGGVRYALPPRRDGVQIVAWPFMVALLVLYGVQGTLTLAGTLIVMALTASFVIGWLNEIIGKELVTISAGKLAIKRSVAGLGMTTEYDMTAIRDVRLMPEPQSTFFHRTHSYDDGRIAFDYHATTVRFAAGLGTPEATALLEELKRDYVSSSTTGHAAPSHGSPIKSPSDAR
ncbi:MAG TPA: hypothetical protein VJZ76_18230 [Thermoanaerobaculia bacterium]|nr:hypothetical protein [Thermoanaerobaculia bacterium]